ncbi:MAG: transcriptional regulatory protein-like protein [Edaphobacter sp.]|nr:transcriptional regulatory protein-like protein [Edaphobacter sp.]
MERKCLIFSFADIEVRESEFNIVRNGEVLAVEPKAFRVLLYLLRNPHKLITKDELLDAVWSDTAVSENSLTRSIALLRKLLADDIHEPRYIATVPTVGYRFLCDVNVTGNDFSDLNAHNPNPAIRLGGPVENQSLQSAKDERKRPAKVMLADYALPLLLLAGFLVLRAISIHDTSGHTAHHAVKAVSGPHAVPLTTVAGNVWDPAFSPDGKQIAFMWDGENPGKGDLYVQLVGAEKPLRLTHTRRGDLCCADWSPDGQEIVFGRCTDNDGGVYVVPALGGTERKLTDVVCPFGDPGQPKWTADGKSLVLADSCVPGGPRGIVVFSLTTGEKRCLTAPPPYADSGDAALALSPNRETIAFFRTITLGFDEIYTIDLSGKNLRQLTHDDHGIWRHLMWTPDGQYIVFNSSRSGVGRPWRVPAKGGDIESESVYPEVGTLTPDGQRLAYIQSAGLPPATWRAELANPADKVLSLTEIVVSAGNNDSTQFSPDERQIVFRSGRTGSGNIWKSNADGSDPQRLTSFDKGWAGTPRWSSDGKWIVFDFRKGQHSQITMVDAEGRNLHDVVSGNYENEVPSWSRDGKSIYFASNRTGNWQIWKRELATGRETQVTRNGGLAAFESYDAKTLYYSKFEGGGIWSMPVGGGAEEHITDALHRGYWGHFAVTEAGIYLLDVDATPRPTIMYYSFEKRQLRPVLQLEEHPCPWMANLSASRDGRTLLFGQWIPQSSIVMAENF